MRYSRICPKCGSSSDEYDEKCPNCGAEKVVNVKDVSLTDTIYEEIDNNFDTIDHASMYIRIAVSGIILIVVLFVLPESIRDSGFFWMIYFISFVYGVVKHIENHYKFNGLYSFSKQFLWGYIGGTLGSIVHYITSRRVDNFHYFFDPLSVINQLFHFNLLVILGIILAVAIYRYLRRFERYLF